MTDKVNMLIWFYDDHGKVKSLKLGKFLNSINKRINLGNFLKDINKGLTTRNTSIQDAKKCVFLTRMDFGKPYIFFCTYLDARKWRNKNE